MWKEMGMNWDFATSLRSVEWHAEAVKLWEAAQESEHLQMTQELLQQGLHECLEALHVAKVWMQQLDQTHPGLTIIFLAVMASLGALFFERVQRGVERTAAQQAEKELAERNRPQRRWFLSFLPPGGWALAWRHGLHQIS
eukprot:g26275.t1